MAKFNSTSHGNKTTNPEGEKAYKLSPKVELVSAVLTTFIEDKFYEKKGQRISRIEELVSKVAHKDPAFVGKLAIYTRQDFHMRSAAHALVGELAKQHKGDDIVRRTITRFVERPDDITELLAYVGRPIPTRVKKGVSGALGKFDEYQFAKYQMTGRDISLVDVFNLCHPVPPKGKEELYRKVIEGTLKTAETWESKLSKDGQSNRTKNQSWEEMIDSRKMGYMATLRNLRNILEAAVSPKHIEKVCTYLTNPKAVANSKQFPYRFYSAYRELECVSSPYTKTVLRAVEEALRLSCFNLPQIDEGTTSLVAVDTSGSMQVSVSNHSKIQMHEIGAVMGAALASALKYSITMAFSTTVKVINCSGTNLIADARKVMRADVGVTTNGYLIIEHLLERNIHVNQIYIFTDNVLWHMWDNGKGAFARKWHEYKRKHPDVQLYMFDLAGYGTTPVDTTQKDVYLISGWSDKIFEVLELMKQDKNALVNMIDRIEL